MPHCSSSFRTKMGSREAPIQPVCLLGADHVLYLECSWVAVRWWMGVTSLTLLIFCPAFTFPGVGWSSLGFCDICETVLEQKRNGFLCDHEDSLANEGDTVRADVISNLTVLWHAETFLKCLLGGCLRGCVWMKPTFASVDYCWAAISIKMKTNSGSWWNL